MLTDLVCCGAAQQQDLKPEKFEKLFAELDTDGSNSVDKDEFLHWWLKLNSSEREAALGEDPDEMEADSFEADSFEASPRHNNNKNNKNNKKSRKRQDGEIAYSNPANEAAVRRRSPPAASSWLINQYSTTTLCMWPGMGPILSIVSLNQLMVFPHTG